MGCTSDFSNPWLNQGLDAWEKYYNYGSELPGTFLVFTKILALEAQKRVKNNDPFWKACTLPGRPGSFVGGGGVWHGMQ
jgi:hypothetical protein